MSTDWTWRVAATLRTGIPADAESELQRLVALIGATTSADLLETLYVRFGPGTSFDGAHLAAPPGASIHEGRLRIFAVAQNLERAAREDDDGFAPAGTERDRILGILDRCLEGPVGEVVGCMASEYDPPFHGHPLVRCKDGRIRMIRTTPDFEPLGWVGENAPGLAPVPSVLDVALLRPDGDVWSVSPADLIARYALDGMPAEARAIG